MTTNEKRAQPLEQLSQTLSLLTSVIKSGEPWTDFCKSEAAKAWEAIRVIRARQGPHTYLWPKHCPFCGHDPKTEVVVADNNWRLVIYCNNSECPFCKVKGMDIHEWNCRPERIVPGV